MDVKTAVNTRRSIRRFKDKPVPVATLMELVDAARLYPSGGNMQPLRFCVLSGKPKTDAMFELLNWAMYLPGFEIGPDERPPAYIVILGDTGCKRDCMFDAGAAAVTIALLAVEKGLDTCCLGITRTGQVRELLGVDGSLKPVVAVAVGHGKVTGEAAPYTGSVRYWLSEDGNFRVPKLSLEDVLIEG